MKIPEVRAQELLRTWPVARLATCDARARPRLVPIVFAYVAGKLWSPIDGKPKLGAELARVRHLRANAAAGVLLDAYGDDWEELWWISLDGAARVLDVELDRPPFDEVVAALRAKYPQYATVPLFSDPPRAIAMGIERMRTWCAGPAALRSGSARASPSPSVSRPRES